MNTQDTSRATINPGAAVLWGAALVIAALIITQAGRLSSGNAALADVAVSEDLTVATIYAGDDDDVVALIDRQTESLYIYGIEQGNTVELYQVHPLSELFGQGRGASTSVQPTR
jgi:hypothetical protein